MNCDRDPMSDDFDIGWSVKAFDAMTLQELHDVFKLRVDVFVVEQKCVYQEIDGRDPEAHHVLGHDATGRLVAYARILPPHGQEPSHIGRVVVHPEKRGQQLGRHLMRTALNELEKIYGSRRSALSAQAYLVKFYGTFGYVPVSDPYDWDGIPHVDMRLEG